VTDTVIQMSPRRRARTRRRWLERTPFMPASGPELAFYAILALTAGLCEELVFRGFLVSYFAALIGPTWPAVALAIAIPAVVFAIGHVAQGVRGVVGTAGWAVVGGIVLIETGSLWPAIAAHASWDLVIGVVGSRLLRDRGM
jgi:membrane protease YdiL (CAAX protease family)